MKIFDNPPAGEWRLLSRRPQIELSFLDSAVRNIINRVRKSGDAALRELTLQYDKAVVASLQVTAGEVAEASALVSPRLKDAIRTAASNIEKFHRPQKNQPAPVETTAGVTCWRKAVPIRSVGIYIPGGTAPLFSTVLMLGTPARLAGCEEVVLCTPPDRHGKVHPAILFSAHIVGVTKIFKVGGAQAIAAMALGTETIPAVHKIFGPGNQYVTKAKQLVTEEGVAIDMPAGPSEVLVVADETANARFVAADLLSQAEHGEDSQVMLVLLRREILPEIQRELEAQVALLPRRDIAERALAHSRTVIFADEQHAAGFINEYAPEHLIVNVKNPRSFSERIINAGSVFLGNYSPEAVGDYASGTNHTLPTNGYAKAYAGVSLESFMKNITFQEVTKDGILNLGPVVEQMAEAEQLVGHKLAVRVRLDEIKSKA